MGSAGTLGLEETFSEGQWEGPWFGSDAFPPVSFPKVPSCGSPHTGLAAGQSGCDLVRRDQGEQAVLGRAAETLGLRKGWRKDFLDKPRPRLGQGKKGALE